MDIRVLYTDGENIDFINLCKKLDEEADKRIGAEKRKKFHIDNNLDVIHDVFVAYVEKQPAACVAFKEKGKGTVEVKRVFTDEKYRGLGLSKKLMLEVEQLAKKQGYKKLILETNENLVAAVAMYKKLGYQRIENFYPYEKSTISVCMSKAIV
jgi:GNAT superfamily N-acetyltransferase